ncbi:MAG: methyltransferase domain-containing protein [Planctomycetes bacterium]|nr:methyltransferase domain-containing protein [Planctomycetota bacterium]MCP4838304.1 methyltransferase domain-containing protein [Planctomycetota bacterium]
MARFLIEALRRRKEVGAVAASGRHLAKAITRTVGGKGQSERVLEVGAGTGAFTNQILDRLGPGGKADIVELNPRFCEKLRSDIVGPWSDANRDRSARVIESCIEDADLDRSYTTIVCGLPFNSFPPDVADRILQQLVSLLAPGGTLAFFEYAGFPSLRCVVPGPWRSGAREHRRCLHDLSSSMRQERTFIFRNILPAWAVFLRAQGA